MKLKISIKVLIYPKISVEILMANVYGAQAYEENLKSPKEIFLRFHSGIKKPLPIKMLEGIERTSEIPRTSEVA